MFQHSGTFLNCDILDDKLFSKVFNNANISRLSLFRGFRINGKIHHFQGGSYPGLSRKFVFNIGFSMRTRPWGIEWRLQTFKLKLSPLILLNFVLKLLLSSIEANAENNISIHFYISNKAVFWEYMYYLTTNLRSISLLYPQLKKFIIRAKMFPFTFPLETHFTQKIRNTSQLYSWNSS